MNERRVSNERKRNETNDKPIEPVDSVEDLLKQQLFVRRPVIKKQRPSRCIPTLLKLKTKTDYLKDTESVEFDKKFFINR